MCSVVKVQPSVVWAFLFAAWLCSSRGRIISVTCRIASQGAIGGLGHLLCCSFSQDSSPTPGKAKIAPCQRPACFWIKFNLVGMMSSQFAGLRL